jgi:hypothetical protein
MPGTRCICGNRISYEEIPNPNEWLCIGDVDFEKYPDTIDHQALYMKMTSFLKCSKCGRLWFFWEGFDRPPTPYSPEIIP